MIKNLTKITDIQIGDLFLVIHPDSSTPLLTKIDSINTEHHFCSYSSPDKTYFSKLWEKNLSQAVLLRKTIQGIDLLAGEEVYGILASDHALERLKNHEINTYLSGEGYRDEHRIIR